MFTVVMLAAFGEAGEPYDEGAYLTYGELVRHGWIVHRDFESFYGPGNSWLLAGVFALSGPSLVAERFVGLVYDLFALVGVMAAARLHSTAAAVGAGLASAALLASGPLAASAMAAALGLSLNAIALLAAARSREDGRTLRISGAGVAVGVALLIRPDFAVPVGAAALSLLLRRPRLPWRPFLAPVALAFVVLGAHVAVAGLENVRVVVRDLFSSGPAYRLPLPSPLSSAVGHLLVLTIATSVTGLLYFWRRPAIPDVTRAAAIALSVFSLVALLYAQTRISIGHLVPAAVAACTVGAMLAARARFMALVPVVAVLALVTPTIDKISERLDDLFGARLVSTATVRNAGRSFILSPDVAGDVRGVLRLVQGSTKPGDRIFVGPADLRRTPFNDIYLYWLLPQLRPATYYIELKAGVSDRPGSRLPAELPRADVLVLNHFWDAWDEPNDSRKRGPDTPNRIVRRDFCLLGHSGTFDVLHRCHQT